MYRPSKQPPESVLGADSRATRMCSALGARSGSLTGRFRLTMTRGWSPWRTCCGIWVRTGTKITTISLGIFRANRGAPDTARDAVLLREQRTYLHGRADSRDTNSYKEKITLPPGPPSDVPIRLRTALGPEGPYLRERTDPCSTAVHIETHLPLSHSRLSLELVLLLHQDLHVSAAPGGLTPGTFNERHAGPPTHAAVNLQREAMP
ncbi:hypothetical protein JTE90_027696 [Oedothorax gibbosus]|uniref:Uncharacterized protein n=1 Tax=Oedothorax gibbosus TaxID=931172 RepID=A0AAV6TDC4_9ARAC|nr:hypothetical protein JTE90_027696 [Oedothorax gibbosus]